jgi:hypothetical protein
VSSENRNSSSSIRVLTVKLPRVNMSTRAQEVRSRAGRELTR